MKEVKRAIRLALKIPGTPLVLLWTAFILASFYVVQFFQWVYNASEEDRETTAGIIAEQFDLLKRWFTEL